MERAPTQRTFEKSAEAAEVPGRCLLVDDLPENLVALEALIRPEGAEIHRARSGVEALELLLKHDFAVAIIDVQMPEMNGFELAETMRSTLRTRKIPIIFVTAAAADPQRAIFRGYEAGAVDFLFKPLDPMVVRSKVRVFLDLHHQNELLRLREAEQRRLAEKLAMSEQELKRALASRDEFLGIASHELKTPLTSLGLNLRMLQKLVESGPGLDPRFQTSVSACERQMKRLAALVENLLDLTKIANGRLSIEKSRVDLSKLVEESITRNRSVFEMAACPVELSLESGLVGLWDPDRIEQVIENLVSNATKYGCGTTVEIRTRREGSRAQLEVADHGAGIPADKLTRIFERFERGGRQGSVEGLGLGLYITRQIVEAHGGSIEASSEPGVSTTFRVELPLDFH